MVYWAPSTRIRFCLKTEIFFSGLAHKKCSFLKSLSLSFTCGWTKTQVFEYDDIIRHLPKHYACSVRDAIVFPLFSVFAWTAENDSNTLRVDAYFFFENGGENLRFQKYPDTFGRGLKLPTCRRLAEKTTSGHRTRRFHRP